MNVKIIDRGAVQGIVFPAKKTLCIVYSSSFSTANPKYGMMVCDEPNGEGRGRFTNTFYDLEDRFNSVLPELLESARMEGVLTVIVNGTLPDDILPKGMRQGSMFYADLGYPKWYTSGT